MQFDVVLCVAGLPVREVEEADAGRADLVADVDVLVTEQTLQIAGFNILECADVDEAIEVASKNPGASFGVLEYDPSRSRCSSWRANPATRSPTSKPSSSCWSRRALRRARILDSPGRRIARIASARVTLAGSLSPTSDAFARDGSDRASPWRAS